MVRRVNWVRHTTRQHLVRSSEVYKTLRSIIIISSSHFKKNFFFRLFLLFFYFRALYYISCYFFFFIYLFINIEWCVLCYWFKIKKYISNLEISGCCFKCINDQQLFYSIWWAILILIYISILMCLVNRLILFSLSLSFIFVLGIFYFPDQTKTVIIVPECTF